LGGGRISQESFQVRRGDSSLPKFL
jgi:hypothetical protein